jgi:hydrogenase expression/formation protein HypC
MCLAVPGRIVEFRDEHQTRMAIVDFDGIRKDACVAYLPDVAVGDYVLVHVGFAISKVDERSALESLAMFQQLGTLEENLGVESETAATGGQS